MRSRALIAVVLLAGCPDPREGHDAGALALDAGEDDGGGGDAGGIADAGASDAGSSMDAGRSTDAGSDAGVDAGAMDAGRDAGVLDAGPPVPIDLHVHIEVSNTCEMRVTPTELTVPAGQTAFIDWHNHSRDYPVDVWMSYGGGYLDLAPGDTWDERFEHCATPLPHTEYADIDTACSGHRFLIHCL